MKEIIGGTYSSKLIYYEVKIMELVNATKMEKHL